MELSGVNVTLGGNEVLRGINWRVDKGENWAVIGPNGAGKTTLLLLISGYLWPSSGSAIILGRRFGNVDLRDLRRNIGLVSQYTDDWFEEERVLDIVASGASASARLWKAPNPEDKRRAASLLRRVGCVGHDRKIFRELSQGERGRVAIARAMMARPRLITFDEPCAGLDIPSRESFLSTLSRIAEDDIQNMIYVTHRVEEIPRGFSHALLLKKGRVVAKGRIGGVLTGENLSRTFGVDVKVKKWHKRFYAIVGG